MAERRIPSTTTAALIAGNPIKNLSVLAYANRFTLWHYRVAKVRDAVAPGHFDEMREMLAIGDHMHVTADDGAALLYVRSIEGDRVTVAWLSLAEHPSGAEG